MNGNVLKQMWAAGVVAVALIILTPGMAGAVYSGGAGTGPNPYRIASAADWATLALTTADWDKTFLLVNDVDFGGAEVTPAGTSGQPFTGVFDGDGHVVRNVRIHFPEDPHIGLFSFLDASGEIRDLGMEGADITGNKHVGGLVGYNDGGTITSCYVMGTVTGWTVDLGVICIGGLVGYNDSGTITSCFTTCAVTSETGSGGIGGLVGKNAGGTLQSCYAAGSVHGTNYIGGLVGTNEGGTITSCCVIGPVGGATSVGGLVGSNSSTGVITLCYSTSPVDAAGSVAGGLVGYNYGAVTFCYARGAATGYNDVGGLVGQNYQGTIRYCYSTGVVGGHFTLGGLVGMNDSGTISESYWDKDLSGQTTSAGGTGRTTDELTYPYAANSYVAWDFETVWAAGTDSSVNDGYPYLLGGVVPEEGEVEGEGESVEGETEGELSEGETEGEAIEGETEGEAIEGEVEGESGEGEGESEGEGEGEEEACGCCKPTDKDLTPGELLERTLGDWLLIGLSLTIVTAFVRARI